MRSNKHEARASTAAGQFYPGEPGPLAGTVDRLIAESPSRALEGEIVGLIVPHAGYDYSGAVAAAGYRGLEGGNWPRVVIIAPSHREIFPYASLLDVPYETPLGSVPVDVEFVGRLLALDPVFRISPAGHRFEHSLEVQLPFLQRVAPDARIVPLVLSDASPGTIERVGRALAQAASEMPALLVASSDLYHGEDFEECVRSDRETLSRIFSRDPRLFIEAHERGEVRACGAGPIGALLAAARDLGADRAELFTATNSGEVTGNRVGYVVGYAAVALLRTAAGRKPALRAGALEPPLDAPLDAPPAPPARSSGSSPPFSTGLSPEDRFELLRLARASLERAVQGDPPPAVPRALSPALAKCRAAFVTLRHGRQLRGCIGYADARHRLAQAVVDLARAAALEDLRFFPVDPDELAGIGIEISVLSDPVSVHDPGEIEIGRDGLVVTRGSHRGLLLPQVAVEQGWDRETFLEHCCIKAGLPPHAWSDGQTEIRRFQAEVFGSGEPEN